MDNKNNTRFCEKCGNQIKNSDRFCEHCGAEIKPLPMTSVNEKPTDIKSDKKSKKKLVVIISVVSAIAIVLTNHPTGYNGNSDNSRTYNC